MYMVRVVNLGTPQFIHNLNLSGETGEPRAFQAIGFFMRRSQNSYKTPSKSLVATKSSETVFIARFTHFLQQKTWWWFQRFLFSPILGDMIQFDEYFSDGLTPLAVVNRLLSDPRNPCPVIHETGIHEMGIPILADIVDIPI